MKCVVGSPPSALTAHFFPSKDNERERRAKRKVEIPFLFSMMSSLLHTLSVCALLSMRGKKSEWNLQVFSYNLEVREDDMPSLQAQTADAHVGSMVS